MSISPNKLISIFKNTPLYTSILYTNQDISNQKELLSIKELKVFYRIVLYKENLYFILYNGKEVLYSIQNISTLLEINNNLNPSIEFHSYHKLCDYIVNIIPSESNVCMKEIVNEDENNIQIRIKASFDVVSFNWNFICHKVLNNFSFEIEIYITNQIFLSSIYEMYQVLNKCYSSNVIVNINEYKQMNIHEKLSRPSTKFLDLCCSLSDMEKFSNIDDESVIEEEKENHEVKNESKKGKKNESQIKINDNNVIIVNEDEGKQKNKNILKKKKMKFA